ncbi:MAG: hypothetical protein ACTJF0_08840 [Psychroflexus halocasei]
MGKDKDLKNKKVIVKSYLNELLKCIERNDIQFEILVSEKLDVAHPDLEDGKGAVYLFFDGDNCLKVGKAGLNAKARYKSHHYYFSTQSTLAKSILNEMKILENKENRNQIRKQIRTEFNRMNILFSLEDFENQRRLNDFIGLVEQYFIYEFNPKYEGRKQKLVNVFLEV